MEHDGDNNILVIDNLEENFHCVQTLQNKILLEKPRWLIISDNEFSKEEIYWDRLIYLSVLHSIEGASPFSLEQQKIFDNSARQRSHADMIIIGGIVVSGLCQTIGYLSFLGLLGQHQVSTILTSALIPTAGMVSILFGLSGTAYRLFAVGKHESLSQGLYEQVKNELESLAIFLIQKSFSLEIRERNNVINIVDKINIDELRKIYALQTRSEKKHAAKLIDPIAEAVTFLKTKEILGLSTNIAQEIRICLLEQASMQIRRNL